MNPIITIALGTLSTLFMGAAVYMELRRDLMMLQQNSYRPERYMRWLKASGDTTSLSNLLAYVVFLVSLTSFGIKTTATELMAVFGLCTFIKLFKAKYKKPLALTPRAKRMLSVQCVLALLVMAVFTLLSQHGSPAEILFSVSVGATLAFCCAHILTLGAEFVLRPVEKRINAGFYNAAAERLRSMPQLKIVGITGSYGKTSTKHYLHRILSEHFDTLMTPGSYNTTLGVVRTVNELLKPYNEVFIVEMGAKQPGDIEEICRLVHPQIGVVTAVGPQHLETFGSIDNVCRTKFELVDALPADGMAVINNDFRPSAERAVENVHAVRYGVASPEGCDYTARDIRYSDAGTSFTACGDGRCLELTTPLVGECNISNLLAAVAVATRLGVPDSKIRYAVSKIEPVEHRLSMRRMPGGLTIIDDAFNSNPSGSRMALDVLAMMEGGRRFLITPGMIELGDKQFELNCEVGRHAAACADAVMVVGEYNREAIEKGLKEGGMPSEAVKWFPSFTAAFAHVQAVHRQGDFVLIENDLPDTFK